MDTFWLLMIVIGVIALVAVYAGGRP